METEIETQVVETEVVEKPKKMKRPRTHLVVEGENVQSIAALYVRDGEDRNAFARKLVAMNPRIVVGVEVRLW